MKYKKPEIHARLDQKDFDALVVLAEENNQTLSEMVRHIVYCYLEDANNPKNVIGNIVAETVERLLKVEFKQRPPSHPEAYRWYWETDSSTSSDMLPSKSFSNLINAIENALMTIHVVSSDCTPKDCAIKNQGSLSRMLLTQLEMQLDDFVCEYESDCTGEEHRFSWGFGLDASDEYFESEEDCLSNFLQYLNSLSFNYKAKANELSAPDIKIYQFDDFKDPEESSDTKDDDDDDPFDW
ncbi:hypothetical protein [Chroococcidiopsis sp.]|uniref:hypothetical protein n=1 Tax=Chroococcidiopsis sp. TaxID=3088168 RepID=UPI003F350AD1